MVIKQTSRKIIKLLLIKSNIKRIFSWLNRNIWRKKIFLVLTLCICYTSAQEKTTDAILVVDSLFNVAYKLRLKNTDKAMSIANDSYLISQELNYNSGIQKNLRLLTYIHYYKGELEKSFTYIFEALTFAEEINDNESIGKAENIIGMLHKHLKEYDKAIEHYEKSLKTFKTINNLSEVTKIYNNIAIVYSVQKKYNKAIEMYDKSLDIKTKLNDRKGLSKIYNNLGNLNYELEEYDKAISFFSKSINIKKELNDIIGIATTYRNISEIYKDLGKWNEALENLKRALEFSGEMDDINSKLDIYKSLASIYQELNDDYNTFEYFQKYTILKDSVFTIEKEKEIAKIREQYETEKKDKQIELQNVQIEKSDTENTLLTTAVSFLLILAVLISAGYYQKKKSNRLLNEQKKEISEINDRLKEANITKDKIFSIIAHDLRSPVVSLINMSDAMKKNIEVSDLNKIKKSLPDFDRSVNSVNLMMENLFNWAVMQKGSIPFAPTEFSIADLAEQCIEINKPYAALKSVSVLLNIEDEYYVYADVNMVRSIINNLLNNAVKFSNKGSIVTFELSEVEGKVIVSVKDNGEGIPSEKIDSLFNFDSKKIKTGTNGERGTGLGLRMCKEFAERNNGDISVISNIGEGTSFIVTLPSAKLETFA